MPYVFNYITIHFSKTILTKFEFVLELFIFLFIFEVRVDCNRLSFKGLAEKFRMILCFTQTLEICSLTAKLSRWLALDRERQVPGLITSFAQARNSRFIRDPRTFFSFIPCHFSVLTRSCEKSKRNRSRDGSLLLPCCW